MDRAKTIEEERREAKKYEAKRQITNLRSFLKFFNEHMNDADIRDLDDEIDLWVKYESTFFAVKAMEIGIRALVITGSRSITNIDISEYIPDDINFIITGGANGIDILAEEYADKHRISKLILRPQYELYGKAAPLRRNEDMVNFTNRVLAIWDGKSRGTKYTIDYAKKKGKEVTIINPNEKQS